MLSALIINDVPIECINQAAIQYHVPAMLIISVLKTENGRAGTASINDNGSIDYGPMQINSIWLDTLGKYGYSREDIQYNPCLNVAVGTWLLANSIASGATMWNGVGNYHSHTPDKNQHYQNKVSYAYASIMRYLNAAKSSKID